MTQRAQHFMVILVGISLLIGAVPKVFAVSPPNILSYQGRLLTAGGVPVADPDAEMSFELFNDDDAGTCVWSNDSADCHAGAGSAATQTVILSDGLFSENLGDTSAGYAAIDETIFADTAALWLQVTINGETLTPRKQLTTSPYAFNAAALDGFDTSQAGGSSAFVPVTDSSGNLILTEDLALNGGGLTSTDDLTITAAGGELFIASDLEPSGSRNLGDVGNGWNSIYLDVGGTDIGLEDTGSATTSGAFAIGVFDEFSVTCSTVQDCLDELDATLVALDTSVDLDDVYDNDIDKTLAVDSTSGFIFDLTTTGDLTISDNGTPFVTFTDSGTVGVGDTTPSATFVVGDGDLFQVAGASGNVTTAGNLAVNGGNITTTTTTWNFDVGNTGSILFRDGTNTLLTLIDAGTTGNATLSGNFTVSGGSILGGSGLNLDTNSAAAITVGGTNATSLSLCNSATCDTTTIGTNADADTITIGDAANDTTTLNGLTIAIDSGDWDISTTGDLSNLGSYQSDGDTDLDATGGSFGDGDLTVDGYAVFYDYVNLADTGFLRFGSDGDIDIAWNDGLSALELIGGVTSVGDYAGTIATGSGDLYILDDLEVDGDLDLAGALTVSDITCTDCLDFSELSDTLTLDASTSIALDAAENLTFSNTGTGDIIVDLTSTGDFVLKDNGTPFLSFNDDSSIDYTTTSTTDGLDIIGTSLVTGDVASIIYEPTEDNATNVLSVQKAGTYSPVVILIENGELLTVNRDTTLNSGILIQSGNLVSLTNSATENGGSTIADSSSLLALSQNFVDASGDILSITSAASNASALTINTASTTSDVFTISADSLTTGDIFVINSIADPDDASGRLITAHSEETTPTADLVLISSSVGEFRIKASGEVFSDIGLTVAGATTYYDGSLSSDSATYTINAGGTVEIQDDLTITTGTTISAASVTTLTCTDCINFDDLSDSLTLDTNTGLDLDGVNLTISGSGTGDFIINPDSNTNVQITATAAPGVDMITLTNSGFASTTTGVDGFALSFGASNASGDIIHLTPSYAGGVTNGLTYNGLEFDAFSPTNSAGTDTVNGILLGTLTDPGSTITSTGINVQGGWDTGLAIGDETTEISFTSTSPTIAFANGGSVNWTDGTNTLFTITDAGTSGTITVTGGTISTASNNNLALSPNGSGDVTISTDADTNLQVSASAAPTVDLFTLMANGGNASATNGVDALQINFGTSNASGSVLHLVPSYAGGAADGLTYNILEMDAVSPSNAAGTDTFNGILLGQMTDPGASITSTGIKIGSGWDDAININGGQFIAETNGVVSIGLDNTATTNGLCHSGTNIDAATDTTRDIVPCSAAPADYAEWYETDGTPEAGDVVALTDETITFTATETNASTGLLDGTRTKTLPILTKASSTHSKAIFGIVSTSPIETIGSDLKRQGSHPQPIALNGRVPLHATDENGAIEPGDPLTASSTAGYAMKASEGDVIIAVALDWLSSGTGTIEVFVRYAAGTIIEDSAAESTASETYGASLGTLSMDGTLYLNGNQILSVGRLEGIDDNWSIAEDGTFTTTTVYQTEIAGTTGSTVDVYATMSPEITITLSGTGTLSDGRAVIKFEDVEPSFNDVISTVAPIRVLVTALGPTGTLYVSDKDNNGFTVQEYGGSSDGIEFDWYVIAYRNGYEPDDALDADASESTDTPTEAPTEDTTDTTTPETTPVDSETTTDPSPASEAPASESTDTPTEAPTEDTTDTTTPETTPVDSETTTDPSPASEAPASESTDTPTEAPTSPAP